MKKVWLVVWLALVLAACGPSSPPDAAGDPVVDDGQEAPTAIVDAEQVAEATEVPEEDVQPVVAEEVEPGSGAEKSEVEVDEAATSDEEVGPTTEGDTLNVVFPATTPAEASVVRVTDHVLGAADPMVQIIEYGDFQ